MKKQLSIIICSRNGALDKVLSNNIKQTIGYDYELIIIDNSLNKYSIFEAYNLGLQKSASPFAVFIHEDILFHSQGWGSLLANYFENNRELGLIGVGGSKIRSNIPCAWWDHPKRFLFQNIIHRYPSGEQIQEIKGFKADDKIEEVSVIDGVFIAMRKDERLHFNEKLRGFHNYDQSISIDFVKKGYKVWVTNEILIEHFSLGKINSAWLRNTVDFNRVYRKKLPVKTGGALRITKNDKIYILKKFLEYSRNNDYGRGSFMYWLNYLILNPGGELNLRMTRFYLKKLKQKIVNV